MTTLHKRGRAPHALRAIKTGAVALACALAPWGAAAAQDPATPATRTANAAVVATLPPADGEDEAFAQRGFVAAWPEPQIRTADGRVAWDFSAYATLPAAAPETVNPSLWRHAQLMVKHGLFRVTDRIYQVRGFDVSNMTIIVGDTGLIIVDPLTTAEVARAGLALARRTLGDKPVKAVIYTHSHADHFGGVRGVVEQADVEAGRVQIIAPDGFLEHAVGENIIAGPAMSRRATYQFGAGLSPGPFGQMTSGIGPAVSSGTLTLIAPTKTITRTGESHTVDGVEMVFQYTPGTEAPSEMNFHLPQMRALCLSENANVSMHNVLTPRGALVRDAKVWADYLTQSLRLYGAQSDVMFTSHGWPRWGGDRIVDFIASHRDAYKFLHDQSVRLMNAGLTGEEIAERLVLPDALARRWFNRGYYGTMRHNSKAVYQRYMGWYDGNPARLDPLPPEEAGRRYVAAMGGARKVLAEGRAAIARGDYRWAAQLLDHLVFAEPANADAKAMLAQAHTQLAYQAESAIWRNMYLSAAAELRAGVPSRPTSTVSPDFIRNTPTPMVLDLLAVRLAPERATGAPFTIALVFPERSERHLVTVRNGVLIHEAGVTDAADATVTMPRAVFL
ncbi:MAG: alkyl sulfatase dimerization domain-containing protein, partial [Hyphomonadaceae bacterium]|nr:alkyl sulfatase dimerization domain-containing protein [Hyphomonadaceae bacterium]